MAERAAKDRIAAKKQRTRIIVLVMAALMVLSLVGGAMVAMLGDTGTPTVDDERQAALDELQEELDRLEEERREVPDDVEPCPPADESPEPAGQEYAEPPLAELGDDPVTVTLVTSCGEIVLELDPELAPIASANFAGLALDGFYDGTTFHRTQWNFVVQGGDPVGDGTGGPGYTIDDELDGLEQRFEPLGDQGLLRYPRGVVAMANAGPDTAGSQFFIVQAEDYPFPPAYTVFGTVVEGLDVVDRIAAGAEENTIATDPVVLVEVTVDGAEPGEVVPAEDADDDGDDAEDDGAEDDDADDAGDGVGDGDEG